MQGGAAHVVEKIQTTVVILVITAMFAIGAIVLNMFNDSCNYSVVM